MTYCIGQMNAEFPEKKHEVVDFGVIDEIAASEILF